MLVHTITLVPGMEKVPSAAPLILRQFQQEWPRGPRADGLCSWCTEKMDDEDLEDAAVKKEWESSGLCVECQIAMESDLIDDDDTVPDGYMLE